MKLRYEKADGGQKDIELGDRPVTLGRSGDADVMLLDEKVSRVHCGIGIEDGTMVIRDLQSKNGTFVNDERVDSSALNPGDRIRIGSAVFVFETEGDQGPGPSTALMEMQDAFDGGKGYSTILREIVGTTERPSDPEPGSVTEPAEGEGPAEPSSQNVGGAGLRKKVLNVKKPRTDPKED